MRFSKTSLVSASLLLGQAAAELPPIVMKGSKFFYENGTQFFMKGVAYQQDSAEAGKSTGSSKYSDPLADVASCKRDVPLLKQLRTNTIRTYAIDPTKDHDECMKLLDDAGIYVISDLSEPSVSVNRDDPKWDVELLKRYTDVVDSLSKYSNVIGFFAGNEVTNNASNTDASAYVKAAVRDTKNHIKATSKRWLGVGYAANDDPDIRESIAHYFNCGNQSEAIDYWGYNIYEWCGKSTFTDSGYDKQVEFFKTYSVPVFFAEYGCNIPDGAEGRIWQETTALYSDDMSDVISGGIVYMYHQEANDYGLVKVKGGTASKLKDFDTLATRMASVSPSSIQMDAYKPTNSPAACPSVNAKWAVTGDRLPPTPNNDLCECMYKSLSCVPSDSLKTTDFGKIFNYVCDQTPKACDGINGNTTSGEYGPFSMCGAKEKLGYILNEYYNLQGKSSGACEFKGQAQVVAASADDGCQARLAQASAAASNTQGGSETSKNIAAPIPMKNLFTIGDLAIGAYVVVAMGVGAGMVLL
ncbi:Glucanosyltransferase-domain-containing protein [Triangularia verruculosa]|uniref:1,3-beta-glucanosyltransferase n=1 Tax=Triangularia verruculosa TaxID=2587418 RepID=A0AAN6XNV4_9PEZI|nr:Glucanosyltransferase-domain-containing protein [Triangularia verruculosa]